MINFFDFYIYQQNIFALTDLKNARRKTAAVKKICDDNDDGYDDDEKMERKQRVLLHRNPNTNLSFLKFKNRSQVDPKTQQMMLETGEVGILIRWKFHSGKRRPSLNLQMFPKGSRRKYRALFKNKSNTVFVIIARNSFAAMPLTCQTQQTPDFVGIISSIRPIAPTFQWMDFNFLQ